MGGSRSLTADPATFEMVDGVHALRQIEKQLFGRHVDFVVAWPHDAGTRDKSSGQYLRDLYKQHGLRMMHEHAQMLMKDGSKSNSLEGSIQGIITAERTGKLRIARSCPLYLEERRLYQRDAHGEVVKVRDDVLSAARYAIMITRHWKSLYDSGLDSGQFLSPARRNRLLAPRSQYAADRRQRR